MKTRLYTLRGLAAPVLIVCYDQNVMWANISQCQQALADCYRIKDITDSPH